MKNKVKPVANKTKSRIAKKVRRDKSRSGYNETQPNSIPGKKKI